MKIVVIGGTGLIGSRVVRLLESKGHTVIVGSPDTGVDILTGEGLAEAFTGADVVIDLSNSRSFDAEPALRFFETAARNIAAAEAVAGVAHHVALSVVGTDRLQESGYFRAKLAQEHHVQTSGVPYTLVRATQFFEFIRGIAQAATTDGVVRLAPVLIQPIAADDVAAAVAEVAVGAPHGRILEVAGPDAYSLPDLVSRVLAFDGDARRIELDADARYFGVRLETDSLLPGSEEPRFGAIDLERWLSRSSPAA